MTVLMASMPAGSAAGQDPSFATAGSSSAIFVMIGGGAISAKHAEITRLDAHLAGLASEREELEEELDDLSATIVELKTRRVPRILGEARLTRKLQRSRELSGAIDDLARTEAEAKAELVAVARRLLHAYEEEMAAVRKAAEQAPHEPGTASGRAAIERLVVLEAERRAVLEGLSRLEEGGGDGALPRGYLEPSETEEDDPQELRARADTLRDTRDRLFRRLEEVEQRARSIESQRELERELDGFLSESRFFGEGDRAAARLVDQESTERPVAGGLRGDESLAGFTGRPDTEPERAFGDSDSEPPAESDYYDGDVSEPENTGDGPYFSSDRITTRAEADAALDAFLSSEPAGSLDDMLAYLEEMRRLIERLERRAEALEREADLLDVSTR